MAKDKSSGKTVRNVKAQEKKEPATIDINPGNVGILTVKLLNSIDQTLRRLEQKIDG